MVDRAEFFVWVILPYLAIAVFVLGHIWRFRHDQFSWTTFSTQMLESRLLVWGSNLFHYGSLAAIAGHVLGILVPASWTEAVGVSPEQWHLIAGVGGIVASVAAVVGLVILAYRRASNPRVRAITSWNNLFTYALLAAAIILGSVATTWHGMFAYWPDFDYRLTYAPWFRGLFVLQPRPELVVGTPVVYQAHAILAWVIFAWWPFSRLVHAWSVPLHYLARPPIPYRARTVLTPKERTSPR